MVFPEPTGPPIPMRMGRDMLLSLMAIRCQALVRK